MLSYMLPVEEKTSPPRNLNLNLNLNSTTSTASSTATKKMPSAINLNGNSNNTSNINNMDVMACDENTKLLANEREHILNNSLSRGLKLDNNIKHYCGTAITGIGGGGDGGGGGSSLGSFGGDGSYSAVTSTSEGGDSDESKGTTATTSTKKSKLTKVGTKNVTLKRVSFGSSKGSMVETLVFETPTPLPEHAEREFGFPPETLTTSSVLSCGSGGKLYNHNNNNHSNSNNNSCLDDSGIEMHEELERSKVRVTFFQSSKPQQVSPPDSQILFRDSNLPLLSDPFLTDGSNLSDDTMTAATATQSSYDRQISTESGWDNPFRPGGDLSREADEIVNLIKGGKPITPTSDFNQSIANGSAQKDVNHLIENGTAVVDGATKTEVSQVQSTPAQQNGTKSPQSKTMAGNKTNGDAKTTAPQTQISNQVIPGPISASHVVIDDKKKKKCTCCVIQ